MPPLALVVFAVLGVLGVAASLWVFWPALQSFPSLRGVIAKTCAGL